jgi:hypothetical protein
MQRQGHQLRPAALVGPHHSGCRTSCPAASPAPSSGCGSNQLPVRGVCGGAGAHGSVSRSSRPQAETPVRTAAGPTRQPEQYAAAAVRRHLGETRGCQGGAGWPGGVWCVRGQGSAVLLSTRACAHGACLLPTLDIACRHLNHRTNPCSGLSDCTLIVGKTCTCTDLVSSLHPLTQTTAAASLLPVQPGATAGAGLVSGTGPQPSPQDALAGAHPVPPGRPVCCPGRHSRAGGQRGGGSGC